MGPTFTPDQPLFERWLAPGHVPSVKLEKNVQRPTSAPNMIPAGRTQLCSNLTTKTKQGKCQQSSEPPKSSNILTGFRNLQLMRDHHENQLQQIQEKTAFLMQDPAEMMPSHDGLGLPNALLPFTASLFEIKPSYTETNKTEQTASSAKNNSKSEESENAKVLFKAENECTVPDFSAKSIKSQSIKEDINHDNSSVSCPASFANIATEKSAQLLKHTNIWHALSETACVPGKSANTLKPLPGRRPPIKKSPSQLSSSNRLNVLASPKPDDKESMHAKDCSIDQHVTGYVPSKNQAATLNKPSVTPLQNLVEVVCKKSLSGQKLSEATVTDDSTSTHTVQCKYTHPEIKTRNDPEIEHGKTVAEIEKLCSKNEIQATNKLIPSRDELECKINVEGTTTGFTYEFRDEERIPLQHTVHDKSTDKTLEDTDDTEDIEEDLEGNDDDFEENVMQEMRFENKNAIEQEMSRSRNNSMDKDLSYESSISSEDESPTTVTKAVVPITSRSLNIQSNHREKNHSSHDNTNSDSEDAFHLVRTSVRISSGRCDMDKDFIYESSISCESSDDEFQYSQKAPEIQAEAVTSEQMHGLTCETKDISNSRNNPLYESSDDDDNNYKIDHGGAPYLISHPTTRSTITIKPKSFKNFLQQFLNDEIDNREKDFSETEDVRGNNSFEEMIMDPLPEIKDDSTVDDISYCSKECESVYGSDDEPETEDIPMENAESTHVGCPLKIVYAVDHNIDRLHYYDADDEQVVTAENKRFLSDSKSRYEEALDNDMAFSYESSEDEVAHREPTVSKAAEQEPEDLISSDEVADMLTRNSDGGVSSVEKKQEFSEAKKLLETFQSRTPITEAPGIYDFDLRGRAALCVSRDESSSEDEEDEKEEKIVAVKLQTAMPAANRTLLQVSKARYEEALDDTAFSYESSEDEPAHCETTVYKVTKCEKKTEDLTSSDKVADTQNRNYYASLSSVEKVEKKPESPEEKRQRLLEKFCNRNSSSLAPDVFIYNPRSRVPLWAVRDEFSSESEEEEKDKEEAASKPEPCKEGLPQPLVGYDSNDEEPLIDTVAHYNQGDSDPDQENQMKNDFGFQTQSQSSVDKYLSNHNGFCAASKSTKAKSRYEEEVDNMESCFSYESSEEDDDNIQKVKTTYATCSSKESSSCATGKKTLSWLTPSTEAVELSKEKDSLTDLFEEPTSQTCQRTSRVRDVTLTISSSLNIFDDELPKNDKDNTGGVDDENYDYEDDFEEDNNEIEKTIKVMNENNNDNYDNIKRGVKRDIADGGEDSFDTDSDNNYYYPWNRTAFERQKAGNPAWVKPPLIPLKAYNFIVLARYPGICYKDINDTLGVKGFFRSHPSVCGARPLKAFTKY